MPVPANVGSGIFFIMCNEEKQKNDNDIVTILSFIGEKCVYCGVDRILQVTFLELAGVVCYNITLKRHIYGVKMKSVNRYQLRHAAGKYWLLDMQQDGLEYRKPVMLNECAAFIWKRSNRGDTREQIAEELQREYGISIEQAREDAEQFIRRLREQGLI